METQVSKEPAVFCTAAQFKHLGSVTQKGQVWRNRRWLQTPVLTLHWPTLVTWPLLAARAGNWVLCSQREMGGLRP